MLVLTRKLSESIFIGDNIEATILKMNKNGVSIGISAPKELSILREELFLKKNRKPVEEDLDITSQQENFGLRKIIFPLT